MVFYPRPCREHSTLVPIRRCAPTGYSYDRCHCKSRACITHRSFQDRAFLYPPGCSTYAGSLAALASTDGVRQALAEAKASAAASSKRACRLAAAARGLMAALAAAEAAHGLRVADASALAVALADLEEHGDVSATGRHTLSDVTSEPAGSTRASVAEAAPQAATVSSSAAAASEPEASAPSPPPPVDFVPPPTPPALSPETVPAAIPAAAAADAGAGAVESGVPAAPYSMMPAGAL